MSWASDHIAALQRGETVEFRPKGRSMEPLIFDQALVRVEPVSKTPIAVGDVVLCRVGNYVYVHLVKEVSPQGHALIGNYKGKVNGWARASEVYGRVVWIEPPTSSSST